MNFKKYKLPTKNNEFKLYKKQKINEEDELDIIKNEDKYLQAFNIQKKTTENINQNINKNSNIQLSINPALGMIASRALDGLLGGVNQQIQGPVLLNPTGNNSPLSNPILTPNINTNIPNVMPNPTVPNPNPIPTPTNPNPPNPSNVNIRGTTNPNNVPPISPINNIPNGIGNNMPNPLPTNPMSFDISQNPAFNIQATGTNLKNNFSNVSSSEVVSITIGIVLSLFLFCFISGCLIKMCKPKKRRR